MDSVARATRLRVEATRLSQNPSSHPLGCQGLVGDVERRIREIQKQPAGSKPYLISYQTKDAHDFHDNG